LKCRGSHIRNGAPALGSSIELPFLYRAFIFKPAPYSFEKKNFQGKGFIDIPFGQGKRMCIGHAFAGYQLQEILATLIRQFPFNMSVKGDLVVNPAIIIKGSKPITLTVTHKT
jgi:cytochrome P450